MVLGSGIDVVSLRDVRRELARAPWRAGEGIFHTSELRQCARTRTSPQKLAAIFATKEAVVKALGVSATNLQMLAEIEVGGRGVTLHGALRQQSSALGVARIFTASHAGRSMAAAMVILED